MITALVTLALLASASSEAPERTKTYELSVLVIDTRGEPLQGATVQICRWKRSAPDSPAGEMSEPCRNAGTNAEGQLTFKFLQQGEYGLRASGPGLYAETWIGPLGIGDASPVAPDEIVVLLNPICSHHCPGAPSP